MSHFQNGFLSLDYVQLLYALPLLKGIELTILPLKCGQYGRILFQLILEVHMKRNYISEVCNPVSKREMVFQTAFHEAGHAAAIYIRNKKKKLPPVFFKITIQEPATPLMYHEDICHSFHEGFVAKVEGGRLINNLPVSPKNFSPAEKKAYQQAYEADIVNLLIGPLAEAKYIAMRDDELINPLLVNIDALRYYGGSSDLQVTNDYLDCFVTEVKQRDEKIMSLFMEAYNFINDPANCKGITKLANYILDCKKNIIDCEEAIGVLDA